MAISEETICLLSLESIPGMRSYWSELSRRSREMFSSLGVPELLSGQVVLDDRARAAR